MFGDSSYFIAALIFYFYLLSLLTSGMLIGVFFDKIQNASVVGLTLNVLLNGVGWTMTNLAKTSQWIRGLSSLLSIIAFSLAMDETIRGLPMRPITLANFFDFDEHNVGEY